MLRKSKTRRGMQPWQPLAYQKRFRTIRDPSEAIVLLQEVTDKLANADKHSLESIILYLRQCADDIQFKYYKARCKYTIIPSEDSLVFWVCHVLGSLPENTRYSTFEGEVLEMLKVLSLADQEISKVSELDTKLRNFAPNKELDLGLALLREEYPIFYNNITENPLLVPLLNFSLQHKKGSVMTIPRLHCLGVFQPISAEDSLIPIFHALAHIVHYQLTEDARVMPPGFINMHKKVFEDYPRNTEEWGEIFAETFIASLLYETEYMPLVAYMELCHQDQVVLRNYFCWLEMIFASSLQENMQKVIHQWDYLRRA